MGMIQNTLTLLSLKKRIPCVLWNDFSTRLSQEHAFAFLLSVSCIHTAKTWKLKLGVYYKEKIYSYLFLNSYCKKVKCLNSLLFNSSGT